MKSEEMKGVFSSELKPSLRRVSIVMTWISAFRFLDRGGHCALGSMISEDCEIMLPREGSIEGRRMARRKDWVLSMELR
jgi:hypothetical protein